MKYKHDKEGIVEALGFTEEELKEAMLLINGAMDKVDPSYDGNPLTRIIERLETLMNEHPMLARYFIYRALKSNEMERHYVPKEMVEQLMEAIGKKDGDGLKDVKVLGPIDGNASESMEDTLRGHLCKDCNKCKKEDKDISLDMKKHHH